MATFPLRCEDCGTVYDASDEMRVRDSITEDGDTQRVYCCDSCTTPILPMAPPLSIFFDRLFRQPKVLAMESELEDV